MENHGKATKIMEKPRKARYHGEAMKSTEARKRGKR